VDIPTHPRQHAFQAGKFTESALHHLVGRIEKALDGGEYALGIFFGIQGAFDNTPITSIKKALHERQVISAIRNWIGSMIEQRTVCVNIGPTMIHIATQRGLPQGGGLSLTLWSMVADSLLILLNRQGVVAQGFADDDGVVIIIGKVLSTLCEIMQRILCSVESWCSDRDLSVNPSKTEMILFTRKYKPEKLSPITFYIQHSSEISRSDP